MKRVVVAALFALACSREQTVTDPAPIDTREPIAIRYVGSPELPVREQPNDTAPVIATYQSGESISVLADKGEWVEVRSGGQSGWARAAELTSAEQAQAQDDNPQPKFKVMPMPVSAPSTHGEIYFEADVNTEGDIVAVKTISNTTGSEALAYQNTEALKAAKFYPIVQNGERKPFKYYHRVTY